MKKRWVRETLYLMLPALLIGGGVLLKTKWDRAADPGPRRLEIVGFKPLRLSPIDVARGMSWGTEIQTRILGDAKLPKQWQKHRWQAQSKLSFVYRQGKVWKLVPFSKESVGMILSIGGRDEHPLRVDLRNVPKEAEEVRMRGTLELTENFSGYLPRGWMPPKNLTTVGTLQKLKHESKPVDVVIKAAGKPMVIPQVSRVQKVSLIEARHYSLRYEYGTAEEFFLHLRHSSNQNWSSDNNVIVDNLKFFDANRKEIPIYSNSGQGSRTYGDFTYFNFNCFVPRIRRQPGTQERFSPDKLGRDLIVLLLNNDQAPRQPWSSYKQPISVEAEVSDGTCWPKKIKATFRHKMGTEADLKEFGEPVG